MENPIKSQSQPILSLCMIVKNEIQNLSRCLNSVKLYVDEMIIVDTGSQDGTPELALQYDAKVRFFEWCDDFAAARNYAVSQASGTWILMLDADEELVVNSEDFLNELTSQTEIVAYFLTYTEINNRPTATPSFRTSLFRNIPEHRYVGRYHESLKYHNQDIRNNQRSHLKSLRIVHYGFGEEQVRQKNISRSIPMLERIRQEEGLSLRLLSCLAGMYADTQQIEKAQECSAELFERLLPNLVEGNPPDEFGYVPDMLFVLGTQALGQKDYETVRLLCQRGLEWCPDFPPLNYLAGATLRALGFLRGAATYFEHCIQLSRDGSYYKGDSFDVSYMTTYPAYDLGCVYVDMGRMQEALVAFELALFYDANFIEAQDKINQVRECLATQA